MVRYVGGPLDGRVDTVSARPEEQLPTVRHVHLHGGPKIVHHYDLHLTHDVCEYRVRQGDS